MRKPTGKHSFDETEKLPVGADADSRLAHGQSDEVGVSHERRSAVDKRGLILVGEEVSCNNEGFQI